MSLTLPLAMVIGVVALLARRTEGSWAAPAALFAMFWASILFVAGLIFPRLGALTSAAIYVTVACIAVWVGSLLARRFDPRPGLPAHLETPPFLRTLLVASLVIGVAHLIVMFARRGFSIGELISLNAIIQVTIANRSDLYGGLQQSTWEWTVFLILYTSTLLGGMLLRVRRTRADSALALSAPVLISMVFGLYGSRFAALYGGAFFVGAYLATSVLVVEDVRVFKPRALLMTIGLGCVIVLGFSLVTQGLRYAHETPAGGLRAIFAEGFSFPATLGLWLDERGFVGTDFTAGARTFTRLVSPLGIRAPALPAIPVEFTSSNIYTVFRDVLEDFGTIGSILFFVGFGWLGRVLFSRARAGKVLMLAPLTMIYAFVLTTPATSIFSYTISIAALVLFTGYVAMSVVILRRRSLEVSPKWVAVTE